MSRIDSIIPLYDYSFPYIFELRTKVLHTRIRSHDVLCVFGACYDIIVR